MTKKEQNKQITKQFMTAVNEVWGITDQWDESDGNINFTIVENRLSFCYIRNGGEILSWKMKGEKGWDKSFEIECEMQKLLNKIESEVL